MALPASSDAAAAKADHQVAMFPPGQGGAAADGFQIRFAGDGKNGRGDAGLPQALQQRGGAAGVGCRPRRGHGGPQLRGQAGGLVHRLRPEEDALGGGKFKSHGGAICHEQGRWQKQNARQKNHALNESKDGRPPRHFPLAQIALMAVSASCGSRS